MARRRTGQLYTRNGIYQLEYMINGKRVKKSLRTRDKKTALAERARIMKPLEVADTEDALRTVVHRLDDAHDEKIRLERNRSALPLVNTWKAYTKAPNRPDSGDATFAGYQAQWQRFLKWIQKEYPEVTYLHDVVTEHAEAYAADLVAAGRSANTFNKHIALLRLVFKVLRKRARLDRNPWDDIARKKQRPNSRRELTTEELIKVCDRAEGELRVLFGIGIYTGMRLGDCATLRWAEVDLIRGLIRRVPNKTARSSGSIVQIPIHPSLHKLLQECHDRPHGEYVLPSIAEEYTGKGYDLSSRIQKHFIDCGIRTHREGTGFNTVIDSEGNEKRVHTGKRAVVEVGFHSLRHTFVSLCRDAKAPLAVVEAIVGHATPAMTRHYTHVGELASANAIAALPAITGEDPDEGTAEADPILDRLKNMDSANWEQIRDQLVAIIEGRNGSDP